MFQYLWNFISYQNGEMPVRKIIVNLPCEIDRWIVVALHREPTWTVSVRNLCDISWNRKHEITYSDWSNVNFYIKFNLIIKLKIYLYLFPSLHILLRCFELRPLESIRSLILNEYFRSYVTLSFLRSSTQWVTKHLLISPSTFIIPVLF